MGPPFRIEQRSLEMINIYLSQKALAAARAVDPAVVPAAVHAAVEVAVAEEVLGLARRTRAEILARAEILRQDLEPFRARAAS